MTKKDMAEKLSAEQGISKASAMDIINATFTSISEALANGEDVSIHGFGTFKATVRPARTCRNPKTGEMIEVAAKTAVKFKATKNLI